MDDGDERMNKAERLAVAGAIAPYLREGANAANQRRVGRLDKDGNVVGYTTLAKVQEAVLQRHKIEIAVQPDVRPKEIVCEKCGKPFQAKQGRGCRRYNKCQDCRSPQPLCANPTCGAKTPKHAFNKHVVEERKGQPWRCRSCANYFARGQGERPIEDVINAQAQAVCPGYGEMVGRCLSRPPKHAFTPSFIAKRNAKEWLCKPCATRKRHVEKPLPAETRQRLALNASSALTTEHRQRIGRLGWEVSMEGRLHGHNFEDLVGRIFGQLTVLRQHHEQNGGSIVWVCKCSCGNEHAVAARYLKRGSSSSCGCSRRKKDATQKSGK